MLCRQPAIGYDLDPAVIQTVDAGDVQVCHPRVGGHPGTRFAANPSCCSLQWSPPNCVGAQIAHRPSDGRPKGQECDGIDKSAQTMARAGGVAGGVRGGSALKNMWTRAHKGRW